MPLTTVPTPPGLFEQRQSPNAGIGVFAIAAIPSGTRILCEAPLFALPDDDDVIECYLTIKDLPLDQQSLFWSLAASSSPPGDTDWIGELRDACDDRLTIHALRDIRPGEEICTAYIDICHDTAERRRILHHWGFKCCCEACETQDPAREARRSKLEELMTVMQRRENKRSFENWGTWDYAEALATVEKIICLMLEDGLEETDTLGVAYENAAEYNLAMGCKEDAVKWAEKDLEIERKCCGEDSDEYANALKLLESARAA
ncbi:unnamed protein product [Aureobasidium uvarum]|uniref:SET domain-containing protein n=1 Tax=Aureobasidium uvarum TaxID=2773716 RepID=A0A9N8KMN7_9PEZI|nr:unnamed protein product [Aureobasidium uvarum]